MKWHDYFSGMARYVSRKSKDPSTKVGAVATGAARQILGTGYNGLPRGVHDLPERMERPQKYLWTAHAEENLVAHAARQVLEGSRVYVTHFCCAPCTRMLINSGVAEVVVGAGTTHMGGETFDIARTMFEEAGVGVRFCEETE